MRMIDLANQRGPLGVIDTPTAVECGREVRFRRSFRSLVECVVPCCGLQTSDDTDSLSTLSTAESSHGSPTPTPTPTTSTVTGTFFGYRKGRVSFCLQDVTRSSSPLLLLDFAVPTSYLAREMQHGFLRITLECNRHAGPSGGGGGGPLFEVPVWSMYCNGRKVGYAMRRQVSGGDAAVLRLMRSVSAGAGVLPVTPKDGEAGDGDLLYLRAGFERVVGSIDSESFHMINPVGSSGQELSIFLFRS